ncbi:TonB-dependent receptor [Vibrio parahaemolyticus]|nr:TonB-dependent receptor [Vibrio parahaemolyticus]EIA1590650.1 TonB-dependent receptor [Vibrio parahaemolyticus]EIA1769761.1 TonB-dependent receptor [Vibrio parahaemolyticus]
MKKRWVIALLLSSPSQASWHVEPHLYSGDELGGGVMAYYSLPWFDVGAGMQSVFDASKDERNVDTEVQLSKAFQLSENWAFSIGFGSLLGKHWLSDYQLRYRVGDFSWLTAGYRYHLDEDYDNQNQFYLGYRLSLSDTAEALALSPAFSEFMMDSEFYAHGLFGVGADAFQWGLGAGVNFASSPWGLELNMARSGSESLQGDDGRLGWMALSGTYRWEHFLVDDLTLRGGLGVASVHQERCCQVQEDTRNWALTPDVELSYRLGQYWDVFGGYRFFVGDGAKDGLSPNTLTLGLRAYWSRQSPVMTLLNDEHVPPAMQALRANTFALSSQVSQTVIGEHSTLNQFFIQPDATGVNWQSLVLTLEDGQEFRVPLTHRAGRLMTSLPDGKQKLRFTLVGQEQGGAIRQVDATQLVVTEQGNGVNVLLSVRSHIFGESLHVQAY